MKASVTATEMLKLPTDVPSSFIWTNSSMSGWSTRRMPMLAPRRVPPCLTASVAASMTLRNETGPEATPWVLRTKLPLGRRRLKSKPVPPPSLWTRAAFLTVSKIESSESSIGRTKQAERHMPRPAPVRVGLFGRKSRPAMARKNSSAYFLRSALVFSAEAM
jgi:hypothetical protein